MRQGDFLITRDLVISSLFETYPEKGQKIAQALTNAGLHCVGCDASTFETIEAGMYGHGFSDEEIDRLIGELNQIVAEKSDPLTITMTPLAAEKFIAILESEKKAGWALRFGDQPGGCGGFEYTLDYSEKAEADDVIYEAHGVEIHVNKAMLPRLLGTQIDYQENLMGSGFKITNPNVKSSCSCGSSQSY